MQPTAQGFICFGQALSQTCRFCQFFRDGRKFHPKYVKFVSRIPFRFVNIPLIHRVHFDCHWFGRLSHLFISADYLEINQGLFYNLCINAYPEKFGDLKAELNASGDFRISNKCSSLKIRSTNANRLQPDLSFWDTLYDRGVDIVNIDHNYFTPPMKARMLPAYQFTLLCHPWSRYVSYIQSSTLRYMFLPSQLIQF